MRKISLLGSSAAGAIAFVGMSVAGAAPAFAQETATEQCTAEQQAAGTCTPDQLAQADTQAEPAAGEGANVTVTGSRIRRPNLDAAVPITSIQGDEFFQTGNTSVGDTLNDLPALRSTFSQSNSSRFLGTAGLNLLDLRGLGTQRTLVLVNGRRHVAGDILNTATSVDTNTIPTDLIERVDVVTGGNSAIYGSDAIAGVVNFIMRRDYSGIQIRGQGGISTYGDAGSYYISALAGTNFADGRGNIAINFEYARQNDFYAQNRPNLNRVQGFITVDTDPPSAANGSDGTFDNLFFTDIRSGIYSNGGTFLSCCINGPDGDLSYLPYLFQGDGSLVLQTGTPIGLSPLPSYQGGNGSTFREGTQFGLSPRLDRYSVNLLAHFTVSEAFEPFLEAKYVRTDSLGNASGPFFFSGGTTGSPREVFFTDNPYLNPQARQVISDYYGVTTADVTPFTFIRNVVELSNREEDATRETMRLVGGFRGTFNEDWTYEVSANYGRFKEDTRILGNINLQRFLLAIDAVDQGVVQNGVANGNIVCRATIDPAARIPFEAAANPAYAASTLAADVAACVPINLFGEGNITPQARNYLLQDSFATGRITQFVANAFLSGDTSKWFNLPGGPVGFAIGAEYRRETALYDLDEASQAGITFYNAIPRFDPPSFAVKEIFGEIRLPILADQPFFQQLTVSAAGRIADYKGSTGTVYAYNAGIEWSPVRDLRFRGNYSRAVRAPNLVDQFTPLGQNFAPPPADPCALRNIGNGSTTREANCRADGVPAAYDFVFLQSLPYLSGGNPDLREETSSSWTIGGVAQPRFLPGFSFSADYYDITVDDVITSPSAQSIINACYDAVDLNNQFCALFDRAGPGGGSQGEVEGQILNNSLQVIPLNYAKLRVRGIDFEVAYRRNFEGLGRITARLNYTRVLQNDTFLNPVDPGRADRLLYELGDPRDAFNLNLALQRGPFTIGYELRYIGKMVVNAYEDFFSVQGRDPEDADFAERRFYPGVFYHDFRLAWDASRDFNFYLGLDNAFNRLPPLGLTGAGGGSAIYNNRGRFFYAGAVVRF